MREIVVIRSEFVTIKLKGLLLMFLLLGMIGIAIAWRWTSLGENLTVPYLVTTLREVGSSLGVLSAIAWITLASVVAVPLGIIIAVAATAFGAWPGVIYTLSGACLGAMVSYGIGGSLGHEALCRFAGARVNALSAKLAKRGVLSVIGIRMLPIAPFAVVNMLAGATHIRLIDFLLGTFLGMIPGAVLIAFITNRYLGG